MNKQAAIQAFRDIIEIAQQHALEEGATLKEAEECDDAIESNNWFIIRRAKRGIEALE